MSSGSKDTGRKALIRLPARVSDAVKCWPVRAGLAVLGALTALTIADLLFPPDLSRYRDRSTLVLDSSGGILRAFLTGDDKWRLAAGPDRVDPKLLRYLIRYEDQRFGWHPGVDPIAALRAAGQWLTNGRVISGASTLTMQTARLLEPDRRGRGLMRKLGQAVRALQLSRRFSKDDILRLYLTLAPYGGNLEGVRAAALAYFGKEPAALSPGEAALLVALPQSPERQRPDRFPVRARDARDKVLRRLHGHGVLDAQTLREALAEPVPDGRQAFPFRAPRLARRLASSVPSGSILPTTLRSGLQDAVEDLAARAGRALEPGATLAVLVVAQEGRQVLAYSGGHDFGGPGGQIDLVRAIRSPGSTLKPFIYAMAFEDGIVHPETLIEDRRMAFGRYAPRNFDRRFQGTVSVRTALQQSLNVPAVAVLHEVGPSRFLAHLRQSGARLDLPGRWDRASLPVALGGVGVSLWDLTALYAALGDGGTMHPLEVSPTANPSDEGRRLVSPAAAWHVRDVLAGAPLPQGWGQARNILRDRSIAFKTGTSAGFQDAWAIGVSDRYTVGVWVGRADGTPRPGSIGRGDAAPIMLQVFSLLPPEPGATLPPPDDVIAARSAQDLPPALRKFTIRKAVAGLPTGRTLRIQYPPDRSTVLYPHKDGRLTLKAEGGAGLLRWLVNGRVLESGEEGTGVAFWPVDGEGFAEVTVVDATGASARSRFRVVR